MLLIFFINSKGGSGTESGSLIRIVDLDPVPGGQLIMDSPVPGPQHLQSTGS